MAKRFYWLKLKENFFEDPAIDWIREQENGAEYILIYQILCLKTMNTQGKLTRTIGEMIVPYEPKKIAEITRSKFDSVLIALELFKKTRLIEVMDSGELYLTAVKEMTGTETNWAEYKRIQREKQKQIGQCPKSPMDNVPQENRDKILENRDIDIDIESIDKREREIEVDSINNPPLSPQGEKQKIELPLQVEQAFEEWLTYKKEKRQAYRPTGERNLRQQVKNKLNTLTQEQVIQAIQLSMASNYQGVIWELVTKRPKAQENKPVSFAEIARRLEEQGE